MSAIQTGSAVCSTVWQGTGSSLPRPLPGLLIVTALMSLLLLTVINIVQLVALLQIKKIMKEKKRLKGKESSKKASKTIHPKKERASCKETADLPYDEISLPYDISSSTDEKGQASNNYSKKMSTAEQSETTDGDNLQISREEKNRSVLSVEGNVTFASTSDKEKSHVIAPNPLYPVKISSSVNYNSSLPVQFQKTSGGDTVFTLWSDFTIRPSDICFLGFNSPAYYSSNRFQNAFDFIDNHGLLVDISKIKSMKLSEVSQYAFVSIHADSIYLQKKGEIKVEVMK